MTLLKTVFTTRTAETRESAEVSFIGRFELDFFSCDKHLISGVTLRVSFLRNRPEYAIIYDDETKDYKIAIMQANLYIRKMTVSDVYSGIETTLSKTPALYRYTEIIPETYLVSRGVQSWSHEDPFIREGSQIAMATKEAFLGSKRGDRFHFQKFSLNSIIFYRNSYPFAGTPLETESVKKLYLNSLEAQAFGQHGHGVPHNDYANHYILVFDLTSTQQRCPDHLYPELTNGSVSFSIRFLAQPTNSVPVNGLVLFTLNLLGRFPKNISLDTKLETKR